MFKQTLKTLIASIFAGFSIGLGAAIFLSTDKIIGSALFSIGLFAVLVFNFYLFTGKVCYVLDTKPVHKSIINVVIIWFGNLIGTQILSIILHFTRVSESLTANANALIQTKQSDTLSSLFVLGFLCNIFIYIAVENYKTNQHEFGKYLGIVLCVMGFIISGTEHCVADMFYIGIAKAWSTNMTVRLIVITLGNSLGGIVFKEMRSYLRRISDAA